MLLLFEFNFGVCANLDDTNSTSKLCYALLQLLAIPLRVGGSEFIANLVNAICNFSLISCAIDDRGCIFGDNNATRLTKKIKRYLIKLEADLRSDDLTTGQDRNILQHCLAAIAKTRGFNSGRSECSAHAIDHKS